MKNIKKLFCLLFVIACLICISINQKSFLDIIKLPKNSTYSIFVSKDDIPCFAGVSNTKNGTLNILSCPTSQAKQLSKNFGEEILGQAISFKGNNEDFFNYINGLDIKVVYSEKFDTITSIYAYNKHLKNTIYLSQGAVNIQFCYNNGIITVGNPVIIGSY